MRYGYSIVPSTTLFAAILIVCRTMAIADIRNSPITCVAVSADGDTIIDGSQAGLRVRDWGSLRVQQQVHPECAQIHDLCLSSDETRLIAVGGDPGEHANGVCYSWPSMKMLWQQRFSNDMAYAVDVSSDGKLIAAATHDHRVVLLNMTDGSTAGILSGHSKPVTDVLFLADQEHLISCSLDQTIRVWNHSSGLLVRSLTNHTKSVTVVTSRPGHTSSLPMIASGGADKTVRFWQPGIGRMVRFHRFAAPVSSAVFTSNGQRLVVGCRDGTVAILNADTLVSETLVAADDRWIHCLAVHPKERTVVIGDSEGQLRKVELPASLASGQ